VWIPSKLYADTIEAKVKAEAVRDQFALHNAQLQAHMDWLRIRVTGLEMERAQLLKKYMNLDVPVPQWETPDTRVDPNTQVLDFNDMGDAAAAALGLSWNPDGTINYSAKQ
jgi:hypothetical protein